VNSTFAIWTSWHPTWKSAERPVSQWAPVSSLYLASAHVFVGFFLSNVDPIAQDFATVL
jgi:hypothetical protein